MKTNSCHIKAGALALLMLSGCTTPKVVGDAYSDDRKGNAYGFGLQSDWTSLTFEVLQSSKIPLQSQKTELMMIRLPVVFAKQTCLPGEVLEVRQIPFKDTQKEVWRVRLCDTVREVETIATVPK